LQTLLQLFGVEPVTTITAESPLQMFSVPEKYKSGLGLIITVTEVLAVQEFALVTVTV